MKIGRNKLCPCGSGRKLKKCCLRKENNFQSVFTEYMEFINALKNKTNPLREHGILIDIVKPIVFQEKKVFAIGNRIYPKERKDETLHEFIIKILCETLGKPWVQNAVKSGNKHYFAECMRQYDVWSKPNFTYENRTEDGVYGAVPNGYVTDLISFAFDVFILVHTSSFPDFYIKRLQNKAEFQGTRYEIAVASLFARLGFKINFLDFTSHTERHPEFIAERNGFKIEVEAKSRHREGVINERGNFDPLLVKPDLENITAKSICKLSGNNAFISFIDVNLPAEVDKDLKDRAWIEEVVELGMKQKAPSKNEPEKYNGIIFTNFGSHYEKTDRVLQKDYLLTMPLITKHPLDNNFWGDLSKVLEHYGYIPTEEDL